LLNVLFKNIIAVLIEFIACELQSSKFDCAFALNIIVLFIHETDVFNI